MLFIIIQNIEKWKALPPFASDYDNYNDVTLAKEANEALKRFETRARKREDPEKLHEDLRLN